MKIVYIIGFLLVLLAQHNFASNTHPSEMMTYENSVDTLRISVGKNKQIEIICPSEEGIEKIKQTDINALVKSTWENVSKQSDNPYDYHIEIQFDDNGENKLIIKAESKREFEELIALDFNKMIELTGIYNQPKKKSEKIVVDRLTTENFRLDKQDQTAEKNLPVYIKCEPEYIGDTLIKKDLKTIEYRGYNIKNVGTKEAHYHRDIYNGVMIDWGVNNYLQDGNIPNNEEYKVRYWGSWYFSMKYNYTHHFGKTNRSPLGYSFWAGFDWYNFKFDSDHVRLQNNNPRFYLTDEPGDYKKSKLTVPYVVGGFMPEIYMGNTCFAFGVYGGVRIGGHAKYKVKGTDAKNKQKDHSIHNLTKYRWGGRVEIGSRYDHWAIFAQYDGSTLFDDNFSPELNPITIGITMKYF